MNEFTDVNISALLNSFQMGYDKRVRPNYGGKNTQFSIHLAGMVIAIFTRGVRTLQIFKFKLNKTDKCAINDPLGQTHNPTRSDNSKFVLFCEILKIGNGHSGGRTDVVVQTPRLKIVITTGRDCGSA